MSLLGASGVDAAFLIFGHLIGRVLRCQENPVRTLFWRLEIGIPLVLKENRST